MIDYNNPTMLGKMMKKIIKHCQRYYVAYDNTVMLYYRGGWVPYHQVMERDSRLIVE